MRLRLRDGLPFVSLIIEHAGKRLEIEGALVDTGSAGTIVSADEVDRIGIVPAPEDRLRSVCGVGGSETVFTRKIDRVSVADRSIDGFAVQVGAMDYGFAISAILGTDFLVATVRDVIRQRSQG